MAAKLFKVPDSVGTKPNLTTAIGGGREGWQKYQSEEQAYIRSVQEWARSQYPADKLAGEIYCFPVADSHAMYVVLSSKPLQLLWLELGDAWQMPDVVRRGLTVKDIRPLRLAW